MHSLNTVPILTHAFSQHCLKFDPTTLRHCPDIDPISLLAFSWYWSKCILSSAWYWSMHSLSTVPILTHVLHQHCPDIDPSARSALSRCWLKWLWLGCGQDHSSITNPGSFIALPMLFLQCQIMASNYGIDTHFQLRSVKPCTFTSKGTFLDLNPSPVIPFPILTIVFDLLSECSPQEWGS